MKETKKILFVAMTVFILLSIMITSVIFTYPQANTNDNLLVEASLYASCTMVANIFFCTFMLTTHEARRSIVRHEKNLSTWLGLKRKKGRYTDAHESRLVVLIFMFLLYFLIMFLEPSRKRA